MPVSYLPGRIRDSQGAAYSTTGARHLYLCPLATGLYRDLDRISILRMVPGL